MVFGCIWTVNQYEPTYCSYNIQNNQWIKNKNKNYLLTMCNNITIQLDCSKVWLIFDWSGPSFIRTADPWESIMVLHAAAMQNSILFIWIVQGTGAYVWRFFLCWIWWSWWKHNFHSFFWCAPLLLVSILSRVSSDIGGEIQKLMVVSNCIVWGICPD
jgi:hypothetical protein